MNCFATLLSTLAPSRSSSQTLLAERQRGLPSHLFCATSEVSAMSYLLVGPSTPLSPLLSATGHGHSRQRSHRHNSHILAVVQDGNSRHPRCNAGTAPQT